MKVFYNGEVINVGSDKYEILYDCEWKEKSDVWIQRGSGRIVIGINIHHLSLSLQFLARGHIHMNGSYKYDEYFCPDNHISYRSSDNHDMSIISYTYGKLLPVYLDRNYDGIVNFDKDTLINLMDIIEKTYHIYAGTCESLVRVFDGTSNTKSAK